MRTFHYYANAHSYAHLYRWKPEEKRWTKKGPIILFIIEEERRLLGYYVYGTKSVALNMRCNGLKRAKPQSGSLRSRTTTSSPREKMS